MDNSFMKAQVTEGFGYWEDNFEMCVALRAIYIKREDLTHDGTPPPHLIVNLDLPTMAGLREATRKREKTQNANEYKGYVLCR